jgi:murein DD-endopeptidase MepM/ murein hydrolase activator NlpD
LLLLAYKPAIVYTFCLRFTNNKGNNGDLPNLTNTIAMLKNLALICTLLLLNSFKGNKTMPAFGASKSDTSKVAAIKITPARPLVEKDIYGYYLNFDIVIKNQTTHVLQLSSIEIAVMDGTGKLVQRKFIDHNGQLPGADVFGSTVIKPGESISLFNPFHTFTPDITIASLKYGFFFNYADNQQQINNNQRRLPMDFDASVIKSIVPEVYIARNEYHLPLKGKIIVWDGHDFYSDNRRSADDAVDGKVNVISKNPNRYAYDLMSIDGAGSMYHGSPFKKENWYVFGQPVYVPSNGKIIEVQNNIPDNEFNGKNIQAPKLTAGADPKGMGNYVIIDHGNGEYSVMQHLEKGSINVRAGDMVKGGQQIGIVGFSGSAMYPRLHYTVISSPKELAAEGIPSYFNDYKLYRGTVVLPVKRSRIDSGDIVESDR